MMYSPAGLASITDAELAKVRESFRTDYAYVSDAQDAVNEKYYETVAAELESRRETRMTADYVLTLPADDGGPQAAQVLKGGSLCNWIRDNIKDSYYAGERAWPFRMFMVSEDGSLSELTLRYDREESFIDHAAEMIYDYHDVIDSAGTVMLHFGVTLDGRR